MVNLALPVVPLETALRESARFIQQIAQVADVVLIPRVLRQIHVGNVEQPPSITFTRFSFLALFIRERLEPNIVWTSAQLDVVRTMVANGLGYTLANVRPRADTALDGRRLYRVALSGDQPPVRIDIATLKELKKTRLVEAFERHCCELISAGHIPGMASSVSPPRRKRR